MRNPPKPVFSLPQTRIVVICFQRIAAGSDKLQNRIKVSSRELRICRTGRDFGIELISLKRLGNGTTEDVLCQNVKFHFNRGRGVLLTNARGALGGLAFKHLKAVRRHEYRFGRLIEAMICPADTLHKPAGTLGCAQR